MNSAIVAQLVEQLICNQPVVGSTPIDGSIHKLSWGVVQLAERRTVYPEVAGSSPAAPA